MAKNIRQKKSKLFFLINSLETGGSERVISELCNSLHATTNTTLYTLKPIFQYKVQTQKIALSQIKNNKQLFLSIPLMAKRYAHALKKEKPDISISFLDMSNIVNLIACKETRIPNVISIRSVLSEVYESGVYGALFRTLIKQKYAHANLIIVNSQGSKQDLVDHFNVPQHKVKVVYNPIDIAKIQTKSKEPIPEQYKDLFSSKNKIVIHVGRLSKEKGHMHLLRIFPQLKKAHPNAKLVFIGDGPQRTVLEQEAIKQNIEKDVHFLGNQTNPFPFLAHANLFVFASYYEGFPNALLEAMALGLPIVSTDCNAGPREILAPDTSYKKQTKKSELATYGILTPPLKGSPLKGPLGNAEKIMVQALITLLNRPTLLKSYANKSKQRIADFDNKKMVQSFVNCIKPLLKEKKANN